MSERKKRELTDYQKQLRQYHKNSSRHVLVLEADIPYQDRCRIFHYADLERKAGNELVGIMKNNLEQLTRTKKYKYLIREYARCKDAEDEGGLKAAAAKLKKLQQAYNVTFDFCRKAMEPLNDKYGIDAVFGLTKAEDVWRGVEKCLYSGGRDIHFSKRGDLPCIRAKQINRGIIMKAENESLTFSFQGLTFGVLVKDRFESDEISAVLSYMNDSESKDRAAVSAMNASGEIISTYRPCYASLSCSVIRGKIRVFVHITIEGRAVAKYNRCGGRRHDLGHGVVGCDIGTQTIAYTSDTEVGLKNLAERGSSVSESERKERLLLRAMDRSKRATNPDNYNDDGTIRKGPKKWKFSHRYMKLKAKHAELCRVNAINRHLAINEDVNHLRSLGDVFVTEPKNAKKLQKRSTKDGTDKNGRCTRKKRFGKSIRNRCPGYFQAQAEHKFACYIEVPNNYRASQYDHTSDSYIKKELSQRMYSLSDGTVVQRDWYSSYLLYSIDTADMTIDKSKCINGFSDKYAKERAMISWITENKIRVLNSGIRF